MGAQTARQFTDETVLAGLLQRRRKVVDAYMRELVPGYERAMDRRLGDMREAADRTCDLLVRALNEHRPVGREELEFSRTYVRHALLRGADQRELLRAARAWQRVLWEALNDIAGPDGGALVAPLSATLMDYIDTLSEGVVEIVGEIEQAQSLTARESRRGLLDDLLAGRPIAPGSRQAAARACGLEPAVPVMVIAARPAAPLADEAAGPVAAVALARAQGDAVESLFGFKDDEIVIVRATADDPRRAVDALDAARRKLEQAGVCLAVGVSAVHASPAEVPAAYEEACLVREAVPESGGLLALAVMSTLDYLFVRAADRTAWNLVPPAIRDFIESDLAQAGLLVDTLMGYVDNNLNVKLAAEKLFVHTNTAHYRLGKIEELTGCDLRNLADLQEFVVAVRLARHHRG